MSKKNEVEKAKQRLELIKFMLLAITIKIDESIDEKSVKKFENDLNNIYDALVHTIETMEDYFRVEDQNNEEESDTLLN